MTYYDPAYEMDLGNTEDVLTVAEKYGLPALAFLRAHIELLSNHMARITQRQDSKAIIRTLHSERAEEAGRLRNSDLTAREVCRRMGIPYTSSNASWIYNAGRMLAYHESVSNNDDNNDDE